MLRSSFVGRCISVKPSGLEKSIASTMKLPILWKLHLYISIVGYIDVEMEKKHGISCGHMLTTMRSFNMWV